MDTVALRYVGADRRRTVPALRLTVARGDVFAAPADVAEQLLVQPAFEPADDRDASEPVTAPAGLTGPLPPTPDSAYPSDAQPLDDTSDEAGAALQEDDQP